MGKQSAVYVEFEDGILQQGEITTTITIDGD